MAGLRRVLPERTASCWPAAGSERTLAEAATSPGALTVARSRTTTMATASDAAIPDHAAMSRRPNADELKFGSTA